MKDTPRFVKELAELSLGTGDLFLRFLSIRSSLWPSRPSLAIPSVVVMLALLAVVVVVMTHTLR